MVFERALVSAGFRSLDDERIDSVCARLLGLGDGSRAAQPIGRGVRVANAERASTPPAARACPPRRTDVSERSLGHGASLPVFGPAADASAPNTYLVPSRARARTREG